jgi:hypothetical protein
LEIGDNFVINVEEGNNKGKDSASSHFTHWFIHWRVSGVQAKYEGD